MWRQKLRLLELWLGHPLPRSLLLSLVLWLGSGGLPVVPAAAGVVTAGVARGVGVPEIAASVVLTSGHWDGVHWSVVISCEVSGFAARQAEGGLPGFCLRIMGPIQTALVQSQ